MNALVYKQNIKAILFDFYGVICNEIGTQWYKSITDSDTLKFLKETYDAPSDTGEISEMEFFDGIAKAVGKSGTEVRQEWLHSAKIDTELIQEIIKLKSNYKVAICSNTVTPLFKELLHIHDIEKHFDIIVSSSEVGMVKPNADIFYHTLEQLGVSPEEAIFFDDRQKNIDGARNIGIKGFLYTDVANLQNNLKAVC